MAGSVDAYLRPYVDGRHFQGVVLLARGASIELARGYGLADVDRAVPNTPATRLRIASISKTFTAAAVMRLVEQGALALGDPVSRFVPDFPDGDRITIHQLLVHTSGLARFVMRPDFAERSRRPHSTEQLVRWIQDMPLAFVPGERSAYSNANYALLAYIIERVTGLRYEAALEAMVLDPLGLRDTGHRRDASSPDPQLASGYVPVGLAEMAPARDFDYSIMTGAGSMYATAADLHRWYRGLRGGQLLQPESIDLVFRRHVDSRGYGWLIDRWLDRDVIRMEGWDGVGFAAQFVHFVDEDLTVVVLCNLSISQITNELARGLAIIALGGQPEPLRPQGAPAESSTLAGLAGTYQFGSDFYVPGAQLRLVEDQGRLLVDGDPPGGLIPLGDGSFRHRQQWFRVVFEPAAGGPSTVMRYGPFVATRLEATR